MIKLIAGFSGYSADDLAHLGTTVAGNLPKIPPLSTLKPTPAEINTAVGNLTAAMAMVGPGRAQALAAAFDALAGLLAEVATNAPQIPGVTDTDLGEIGMPIAKAPTRATNPPPACENLRLQHGQQPGEVVGKCSALGDNIRTYEAQWALDPNAGPWSDPATFPNSRSFKFSGLARGKDVWIRVRARNTIGASAWSDPATIMVT
jgi:hypothetical protein